MSSIILCITTNLTTAIIMAMITTTTTLLATLFSALHRATVTSHVIPYPSLLDVMPGMTNLRTRQTQRMWWICPAFLHTGSTYIGGLTTVSSSVRASIPTSIQLHRGHHQPWCLRGYIAVNQRCFLCTANQHGCHGNVLNYNLLPIRWW